MNICIFAKYLPIHITGGMEIITYDLVKGLMAAVVEPNPVAEIFSSNLLMVLKANLWGITI